MKRINHFHSGIIYDIKYKSWTNSKYDWLPLHHFDYRSFLAKNEKN